MIPLMTLALSPAHAFCIPTCLSHGLEPRLVLPEDGGEDVATTAMPLLLATLNAGLLDPVTGQFVDAEHVPLPGNHQVDRLRPDAPLPPSTLLEVWTRDDDGDRLKWLGEFTTGADPDTEAPAPPAALTAIASNSANGRCSSASVAISASWMPLPDAERVFYEVRFVYPEGERMVASIIDHASINTLSECGGLLPELETGDGVEVEVRSVDLSGNAGAWSVPVADSIPPRAVCGCASSPGPAGVATATWGLWALVLLRRRPTQAQ